MLAVSPEEFDPTLPGLFAGDPPAEVVSLLETIAADVRPESLRTQLSLMAETDLTDLLPRITVPVLLIWGELDVRSPLDVARRFEQAIPNSELVVIPGSGHVSNLERPQQFIDAVRRFCLAHPARQQPGRHILVPAPSLFLLGQVGLGVLIGGVAGRLGGPVDEVQHPGLEGLGRNQPERDRRLALVE